MRVGVMVAVFAGEEDMYMAASGLCRVPGRVGVAYVGETRV